MKNILISILICTMLIACTQTPTAPPTTVAPLNPTATRTKATLPPTWTPTRIPTGQPTPTPRASSTPAPTRTPFPTSSPTITPTATLTPTATVTPTATLTTTLEPGTALTTTEDITAALTLSPTLQAEPVKKVLLGEFDIPRALVLMYGGPHAVANINALLAAPYQQAGDEKYLLLTEIPGNNCQTCSASIGGAVFVQVDTSWEIVVEDKHITTLGTYGRAPDDEFIRLGPDAYGVRFDEESASSGKFNTRMVIITEAEDRLRVALDADIATGQYKEGSESEIAWSYTSEVTFTEGVNPDYYDVKITSQGNKPINGKITAFEQTLTYTFGRWDYYLADQDFKTTP